MLAYEVRTVEGDHHLVGVRVVAVGKCGLAVLIFQSLYLQALFKPIVLIFTKIRKHFVPGVLTEEILQELRVQRELRAALGGTSIEWR